MVMNETASITPALFRDVSAQSSNVSLSNRSLSASSDSSDGISSLLTTVTDLVSGSTGNAVVAEMFA
jgi:hypothetical protein